MLCTRSTLRSFRDSRSAESRRLFRAVLLAYHAQRDSTLAVVLKTSASRRWQRLFVQSLAERTLCGVVSTASREVTTSAVAVVIRFGRWFRSAWQPRGERGEGSTGIHGPRSWMHVRDHLHRGHPGHRRACRRPQVASTRPARHPLPRARHRLRPRTPRLARVSRSIGHSWSSPHPRLVPPRGVRPVRRDDNGRRLLPGRNTPDYMNRSIGSIPLQGETAAPLRIVRDHDGRRNPRRRHREPVLRPPPTPRVHEARLVPRRVRPASGSGRGRYSHGAVQVTMRVTTRPKGKPDGSLPIAATPGSGADRPTAPATRKPPAARSPAARRSPGPRRWPPRTAGRRYPRR